MKSLALGIQEEQDRQFQQLDLLSDSVDKANERIMVTRICILFLGRLWAAFLSGKVHCTSKKNSEKKIHVSMLQVAVGVRCWKV